MKAVPLVQYRRRGVKIAQNHPTEVYSLSLSDVFCNGTERELRITMQHVDSHVQE